MITGEQMRDARVAAGWTQEQLAERLDVTLRTVGNWERAVPPKAAQARLRAVLRDHLEDAGEPPLRSVSDVELLAEIARRFARHSQEEVGDRDRSAPNTRAGDAGASQDPPSPDLVLRDDVGRVMVIELKRFTEANAKPPAVKEITIDRVYWDRAAESLASDDPVAMRDLSAILFGESEGQDPADPYALAARTGRNRGREIRAAQDAVSEAPDL